MQAPYIDQPACPSVYFIFPFSLAKLHSDLTHTVSIGRVFTVTSKGFSGTKNKVMKPQFEKSLSGEYFVFSLGSVELKLKSRHMCCLISILKTLCLTDINLVSMETVLSIVLPSCVVIPSSFHVLADCNCTDRAIYSWKGHNIFSRCDLWKKSLKYNVYFFLIFITGTNDKAGGPHYLMKFVSVKCIKESKTPLKEWLLPSMK